MCLKGQVTALTRSGRPAILGGRVGELDLNQLLLSAELQAAGALVLALLVGYAVSAALAGALARAVARTNRELDQQLLALLRRPVYVTAIVVGLTWAGERVGLAPDRQATFDAALGTVAVAMWAVTLVRAADEVLVALHSRAAAGQVGLEFMRGWATGLVHFAVRAALLLSALYGTMLLWGVDVRAWQVSAGVVGAVLGLAAQDSLGDVLAGVFIAGDATVRLGDVVRVNAELRGRVTAIGWRSTRLLTEDGVEINVPNGLLGAQRVVNESAGPSPSVRLACEFSVELGRTPAEVAEIVLPGAEALPELDRERAPALQFRGASPTGLRFALLVYVVDAARHLEARDAVNRHILAALRAAGADLARPRHELRAGAEQVARLRAALAGQSRGP